MTPMTSRVFAKPVSVVLIAGQITLSIQVPAAAASAQPPTKAPDVKVNRTVPVVTAALLTPRFSAEPTDEEIIRARVFEEPIVPMVNLASAAEDRALADAILAYLEAGGGDRLEALRLFLRGHPESRWRAALLTGMGITYRRTGHFSRALAAWEEAWSLAKESMEPRVKAMADRAIGELFELNSRLGRFDVLEHMFEEIGDRDIRGSATEKVSGARQALWLMHNRTGEAFRCGPLAIYSILRAAQPDLLQPKPIEMCKSTKRGTSLLQLRDLSIEVGRPMRMARRDPASHVYTPSVVHWKVGHFAALVAVEDDRYLVRDPTFGDEFWVSQSTLDEEASGYFLIPEGILVPGWVRVDDQTGGTIWGRGVAAGIDPTDVDDEPECPDCGGGGMGPGRGLAAASIHMMLASIRLKDIPVGYMPSVGPEAYLRVTYNQRETFQPQLFYYSNLGPKWTLDWLSYIEDDPGNLSAAVTLYKRNGGRETSTSFDSGTQSYAPTVRKQAVVKRLSASPIVYERHLPDGSVEVFSQPDGGTSPRKIFLTAIKDDAGNTLTFTYDASLRLVAATDAVGQVTTISYEHSDPLKITKVTDPFGRFATFQYDASGRLARITDVLGLESSFTYGVGDIVKTLSTPYGTTTFTTGEVGIRRWAELTDPMGGKERVEYGFGLAYSDPANVVPTGMNAVNAALDHHNTLYWDKRAMAVAPWERSAATDYHWALVSTGAYQAAAVPLSIKRPLENRVWYNYKGGGGTNEGTVRRVIATGRVLDNGTTQLSTADYNNRGQLTRHTDPLGRETLYEYDSTGLDLLRVKQKNGTGHDVIETRTYSASNNPEVITDAAGQTTTYAYNPRGQVLTVTNAKNETTTYSYDAVTGALTSIAGPVAGASITLSYDVYERVRTTTDLDDYTVTIDYDSLDRPIRITYPDGTYEQGLYRFLDIQARRDRAGRWTRFTHDAAGRLTATRDSLGRTTTQEWCSCGSQDALIDANGNRTSWERDVQGRVTREQRANGATRLFTYEATTSRLKNFTDPKSQTTNYVYGLDDQLLQVSYTNAQVPTPTVGFTYDASYGRLAAMTDGTGTTAYTYHAVTTPPLLGATRLASVDGPLSNDTLTYSYDELGRIINRSVNSTPRSWALDALSRVTSETNSLGTFNYTYDGLTDRVAAVSYPNGQISTYSYFGNTIDRRLQTIHHKYPDGTTLGKFDYTYDAAGNILSWRQELESDSAAWEYAYDTADQLIGAFKKSTDINPVVLSRYAYAYDSAGNRIVEQVDDLVLGATYDTVNQLVTQASGGLMRFEGTVSEPATITVAGKAVIVSSTNDFEASVPVSPGTNSVVINALDPSGNDSNSTYEVNVSGSLTAMSHDANGNVLSDGVAAYEWDARDQLVAVTVGANRTEFVYDGLSRRVRTVEKVDGVTQAMSHWIWCESDVCEQRAADGVTVTRRRFIHGEQVNGAAHYLVADHLGSVRGVTGGTGMLLAGYGFDPWGRRSVIAGSDASTAGFAGMEWHNGGDLWLGMMRAFSPRLGRWLSEDPLGMMSEDGPNAFAYVGNRPTVLIDPLGLSSDLPKGGPRLPSVPTSGAPPNLPVPPGCSAISKNAGSLMVCKPDNTPRWCPVKKRRCTPVVDSTLFYSCLAVVAPAGSNWYKAGKGSGPVTATVNIVAQCRQAATICAEGGYPPAQTTMSSSPTVPVNTQKTTQPPPPGQSPTVRPPQRRGRW